MIRIDELLATDRKEKESQRAAGTANSERFIPSLSTLWREEVPGKIMGLAFLDDQRVAWTTEQGQLVLAEAESGQIIKSVESGARWVWPPFPGSHGLWLVSDSAVWLISRNGDIIRKSRLL